MAKQIGIWLDSDEAHIVELKGDDVQTDTINSEVEHFHVHGGYGSSQKGLPNDAVPERRYLEREKQQFQRYFRAIIARVRHADEVMVMGPAEAKKGLQKEFVSHKDIAEKLVEVLPADKMTPNQRVAKVKAFFAARN